MPQKQQQHAMNPWIIALKADEGWLYDKMYLKWFIIPALIFYCSWVMIVPATQVPIINNSTSTTTTTYLYTSPEGVRMELNEPLNKTRLLGHSIAGVIMIFCSLIQKHSASCMLKKMLAKPASSRSLSSSRNRDDNDDVENNSSFSFLFTRFAHKNVTSTVMLVCVAVMATAGFMMRAYSNLPHFNNVMYLFVSPWIVLGLLIYFSAKYRYCRVHVVIGNALVWSCFAVVFARVLGAGLQRLTLEAQQKHLLMNPGVAAFWENILWSIVPQCAVGLGDAGGYYTGIGFATVFFGVFLSIETYLYFKRCEALMMKKK